jgi:hypothetical protein
LENFAKDYAEAMPEGVSGCEGQRGEEQLLRKGEVLGLGEGWKHERHKRTR